MFLNNVSGSVLILFVLLARKILEDKLPKQYFIYAWYIVMIRFLIPNRYLINIPILALMKKGEFGTNVDFINTFYMSNQNSINAIDYQKLFTMFYLVWIVGIIIASIIIFRQHKKFKKLYDFAIPIDDEFMNNLMQSIKIRRRIFLKESDYINTAITFGLFKPVIILPKYNFTEKQVEYILMHEAVHIKKNHICLKYILIFVRILFWYNPLVYLMSSRACEDIELYTDEMVINIMGNKNRKNYALVLIDLLENKSKYALFNNNFSNKNSIEERILNIMKIKPLKRKTLILASLAFLLIGSLSFMTYASPEPEEIEDIMLNKEAYGEENEVDLTNDLSDIRIIEAGNLIGIVID